MVCFLFDYAYYKISCFERKTAFVTQHFRNLGASGGWPFFDETTKRHILSRLYAFWAITRANWFRDYSS